MRTSVDIPRDLHRRLKEVAAQRGCSARQLILDSVRHELVQNPAMRTKRRLDLSKPIIRSLGKPFSLTNEQIYDVIEFP